MYAFQIEFCYLHVILSILFLSSLLWFTVCDIELMHRKDCSLNETDEKTFGSTESCSTIEYSLVFWIGFNHLHLDGRQNGVELILVIVQFLQAIVVSV